MNAKKIIIIVGIVLALIGSVVGGIWAFNNLRSPEIFEFAPDPGDNPKAQKKGGNKESSESDIKDETQKREDALKLFLEFPYFRLPLIIVPIVRDGHVHAYLHLRIAMKANGREGFRRAKVLLPRLVDGIYSDLYKSFENLWNTRSDPKVSVIKERIFYATEKVLGHKHIETIYIREIIFKRTVMQ
ncbi:MAG: hypothetical protein V4544_01055 [Pseudomonadota bacterium]